jgi:hypothetical protein
VNLLKSLLVAKSKNSVETMLDLNTLRGLIKVTVEEEMLSFLYELIMEMDDPKNEEALQDTVGPYFTSLEVASNEEEVGLLCHRLFLAITGESEVVAENIELENRGEISLQISAAPELKELDHQSIVRDARTGKEQSKRGRNTPLDAEVSKETKPGEITTRFNRFHKSWMGHSKWKVASHAAVQEVAETEDDLSTAWRDCLALGIPWGGRGAGGRGVMRITGETKDVNVMNITLVRGENELLSGAQLLLKHGHRYGIVGDNVSSSILLYILVALVVK